MTDNSPPPATDLATALPVAVETPQHSGLQGALDYTSERLLSPGTLVRVPLGRREVPGIVWPGEASSEPTLALKPIAQVLDALPPLSTRWCELVGFAAAYYQRSVGEMALAVLPPELRKLDNDQLANRVARLRKAFAAEPAPAAAAPPVPELNADLSLIHI